MKLIDKDSLLEIINTNKPLADDYHMKDYVFEQILHDIDNEPIVEAIPISWLTSKGMAMISNDARTELFKLIRAWREEQSDE